MYSCLCAKVEYTIFLPGNVTFRGIFFLNLGIVISIMVYYMGLSKAPPAVPIRCNALDKGGYHYGSIQQAWGSS